jgi:F-type H+-transporting ATPase subunit delta
MKIELEEKVNPSIIGGFILRIEDQQIDASIQSQLRKIQRELVHH